MSICGPNFVKIQLRFYKSTHQMWSNGITWVHYYPNRYECEQNHLEHNFGAKNTEMSAFNLDTLIIQILVFSAYRNRNVNVHYGLNFFLFQQWNETQRPTLDVIFFTHSAFGTSFIENQKKKILWFENRISLVSMTLSHFGRRWPSPE